MMTERSHRLPLLLHLPAQHRHTFMAHTKHRLSRRDAASWNAAERFRFICLIFVFFWLPWAIKRHSSVLKQTLHRCASRFFRFLCLADSFFWLLFIYYFIRWCSAASPPILITWTRLLVMGINLGLTFLSVSDSYIYIYSASYLPKSNN